MQAQPNRPLLVISILVTFVLLTMLIGVASLAHVGSSVRATSVGQIFRAHTVEIVPVINKLGVVARTHSGSHLKSVQFACQSNTNPRPVLCYGPSQIRRAYGVDGLLKRNITGKGSTIVIIDAYGSATLQKDLEAFDEVWGFSNPLLSVIEPFGHKKGDSSWISETSLDVEWAHVMAPDAAIKLVVSKSSDDVDLYYAIKYAVEHDLGDVISLSFGENEDCVDPKLRIAEHEVMSEAAQKKITVVAAAGDTGSAQFTCDSKKYVEAVSFPAADPLVTAVGGTTLRANAETGDYQSESAWNEPDPYNKASGGGYSTMYTRPDYQAKIQGNRTGRAVPDLAFNASVNGGVLIYQSDPSTGKIISTIMGGTSVGTPELAGLVADGVQIAQHRLGQLNPALYKIGTGVHYHDLLHDITSGDNILAVTSVPGYTAQEGWDPITGWGSPIQADAFLQALIAAQVPGDVEKQTKPPVGTPVAQIFLPARSKAI